MGDTVSDHIKPRGGIDQHRGRAGLCRLLYSRGMEYSAGVFTLAILVSEER